MKEYKPQRYRILKTLQMVGDEVCTVHVVQVLVIFKIWRELKRCYSIDSCKGFIIRREHKRFKDFKLKNASTKVVCHLDVAFNSQGESTIIEN